jgi:hypothetical protein
MIVKLRYRPLSVWPYTVEISTLREASPLKQSVKGRVAGSATTEEKVRMKMLPTVTSRHFSPILLLLRVRVERYGYQPRAGTGSRDHDVALTAVASSRKVAW